MRCKYKIFSACKLQGFHGIIQQLQVGYGRYLFLFAAGGAANATFITLNLIIMLITPDTRPLPKKLPRPEQDWQTGYYASVQEFRFPIPYGFLLLCKLFGTTPNEMLADFMDNVSCGSWRRQGRDEAKVQLLNYVIEMKYGDKYFTQQERLTMFTELDAIGMLWPEEAGEKMMDLHVKWRDKYYDFWFKKWWRKNAREC